MSTPLSRRDFLKLLTLLPLLQADLQYNLTSLAGPAQESGLPNVLILVFDALAAGHLSINGYPRQTTPNLDRFAQQATVFHAHHAGGNFTTPGTSSMLTGVYPWTHRAFHLQGTVIDSFRKRNIFSLLGGKGYHRLAYSHNLLATSLLDMFREDIDSFTRTRELCLYDDQFADHLLPKDFTPAFLSEWLLFRGGETHPGSLFGSLIHRFVRYAHKQEVTQAYGELFPRGIPNLHNLFFIPEQATDWLMAQMKSMPRPFLAYFHALPPHEPYTTRRDFVDIFKDGWAPTAKPPHHFTEKVADKEINVQRRHYDEYLAYADEEFGRLFDFMSQNGILDNTVVIFTSDHGESFERGIRGHVTPTLYEPVVHIPLIISKPGQQRREDVFTRTSCVDLLPTLLHLTGQEIPEWCEGEVLPTFGEKEPGNDRPVFSVEAKSNPKMAPLRKATLAMAVDRYKMVYYAGYGGYKDVYELYDLNEDPGELNNIYSAEQPLVKDLQGLLSEKIAQVDQPFGA